MIDHIKENPRNIKSAETASGQIPHQVSQSYAADIAQIKSVSYTNKKTGLTITYPVIITLKIMA